MCAFTHAKTHARAQSRQPQFTVNFSDRAAAVGFKKHTVARLFQLILQQHYQLCVCVQTPERQFSRVIIRSNFPPFFRPLGNFHHRSSSRGVVVVVAVVRLNSSTYGSSLLRTCTVFCCLRPRSRTCSRSSTAARRVTKEKLEH